MKRSAGKFTDSVRKSLRVAREEAARLRHGQVEPAHLLLGLLHGRDGVAAVALGEQGMTFPELGRQLAEVLGEGSAAASPARPPYAAGIRTALALAMAESLRLGHAYVGVEHVLLGVLRARDGDMLHVLWACGAEEVVLRSAVLRLLDIHAGAGEDAGESAATRLPALEEMPGLSVLMDQRRQAIEELRTEAATLWTEHASMDPATAMTLLRPALLDLQNREAELDAQLLLGRRVMAVEREIEAVAARKSEAGNARQYTLALELLARENDLRALLRESSDALRRMWVLRERLAQVTAEQKDEAIHNRNVMRAADLRRSEGVVRQAVAAAEAAWAELLPSLPELPPEDAAPPPPPAGPALSESIFISYHRADDAGHVTGRIYDRLVAEFGRSIVFKDVDSIPLGVDFKRYLDDAVGSCAVVLAVIGPQWHQKLQNPRDFVRIELEAALRRSIPIIPLYVQGASIPAEEELPPTLQPLAHRQGTPIRSDPDFVNDMRRVIAALRHLLRAA